MMSGSAILAPFLALLLLTFVVWVVMYVRRLTFIQRNRIDPQRLTTPERVAEILPEEVTYPAQNLRNLFELPVVFYALCLYLYVTGTVDLAYVTGAWLFVGLRALHSAVHCTRNIVMLRFAAYMASALVVWFMVLRAALAYFAG